MSYDARPPPTYLEALADGFSTEHARKVAACTAGFVTLGGLSGSAMAAIKYAPAIPAAFHAALNTGAPAFAFFSTREYLMLPTYAYLREAGKIPQVNSLHFRNMPETASAGFVTGAALGVYHFRTPIRAVSGGFTFAILATAGQLAFNELNILRINYITRHAAATQNTDINEHGTYHTAAPYKAPFWQRTTERILSVTPIRKVSNEEYADTLRTRIQNAEQELRYVNNQMADVQQRLDDVQRERDGFAS